MHFFALSYSDVDELRELAEKYPEMKSPVCYNQKNTQYIHQKKQKKGGKNETEKRNRKMKPKKEIEKRNRKKKPKKKKF